MVRGKKFITTMPDPAASHALNRVGRRFVTAAPNRTWVADFTHVATWAGVVYVAFRTDALSRIVGRSAAPSKEIRLLLDALDIGLWQRGGDGRPHAPDALVYHSDAGSQLGFNGRRPVEPKPFTTHVLTSDGAHRRSRRSRSCGWTQKGSPTPSRCPTRPN